MSNVRAFLPKMGVNGYFILDTREGNMGDLVHTDKQFVTYNYNVRINNKIKPPCFFIYRIPGKARSDRKFKIIGGGVIEKITEPDENGYVDALVTHGFLLTRPIKQGDERVEGMKWTSKKKNPTNWSHFWDEYGMNRINEKDFFTLVGDEECIPYNASAVDPDPEGNDAVLNDVPASEFTLTIDEEGGKDKGKRRGRRAKQRVGTHIDFTKLQETKNKIGELGELIALDYITEEMIKAGLVEEPEHTSKTEGDGLGYDIKSWLPPRIEVHNEVKATTGDDPDGFYMSPREIEESQKPEYLYRIIRIYNLDVKKGTANIKIYEGPVTKENCELIPTSYKVYHK